MRAKVISILLLLVLGPTACGGHRPTVPVTDDTMASRQPESEYRGPHRSQLGQIEFQADGKHQKYHPEFRQVARFAGIWHPSGGVRADHDAGKQVSQQGRQVKLACQCHHTNGSGKENQDDFQGIGHLAAFRNALFASVCNLDAKSENLRARLLYSSA